MWNAQERGGGANTHTNTQMFTFVCTYYVYKQIQYLWKARLEIDCEIAFRMRQSKNLKLIFIICAYLNFKKEVEADLN